jgi:hypothetical protein
MENLQDLQKQFNDSLLNLRDALDGFIKTQQEIIKKMSWVKDTLINREKEGLIDEKIDNEKQEDLIADHDCHLDELGEGHCDNAVHREFWSELNEER